MAEPTPTPQPTPTPGTQAPPPAVQTDPPAPANNVPGPVPYERFKEVNDKFNDLNARFQTMEKANKDREQKELAEQGKWKELAEKREQELATERRNNLRLKIAATKGLPAELADRLVGDDEAALTADADRLVALMGTKTDDGHGVPPAPRGGGKDTALDITKMTPAQIRENRKKLFPRRG